MNILELMQKYSGITALCIYIPLLILILHIRQLARSKKEMDLKQESLAQKEKHPLDPNDENALVAALMASIECNKEYHTDVRVVSVREVK